MIFEEFNLNHCNMFLIVHIKSSLILGSSRKIQISDFCMKKKISLINISNNSGPNVESCGIPRKISDHLPFEEPTFSQTKVT